MYIKKSNGPNIDPCVLQMLQSAHSITGQLFALSVFFLISSLESVRIEPWRWEFVVNFSSGYYALFPQAL